MRIVVVTDVITRRAGGVFSAVRDMFLNKSMMAQDLQILSYIDDKIEEDLPSWKNIPIKLFKPHFFLYSRKLRNTLLYSDADIYHQQGLWRYSHLLMDIWKKKTGKPIVCTPHGMLDPYIIRKQGRIKRIISHLFFQQSLESVSCFQALCQKELEDIRAYGLHNPIAIIPNGIYLPAPSKEAFKIDEKKHLLFLGRIHEKKGADLLLKAISNIRNNNPQLIQNWHVDVVGWDHEGFKSKLDQIISRNGIKDIVTLHGPLYGEEKDQMYNNCDAYILPSFGEGLPLTVLEAWAWGKPVIISPECHLSEGYDCGAAIRIEPTVDSVEKGICTLLSMSDNERIDMGKKGLELVKEKFTWDSAAEKLLGVYKWLSGKAAKPDYVYEYNV